MHLGMKKRHRCRTYGVRKLSVLIKRGGTLSLLVDNDSSVFQNRGGEIQKFRDQQQNGNTTLFIVQSFPQIGKSAFIDYVTFFLKNTINIESSLKKQ